MSHSLVVDSNDVMLVVADIDYLHDYHIDSMVNMLNSLCLLDYSQMLIEFLAMKVNGVDSRHRKIDFHMMVVKELLKMLILLYFEQLMMVSKLTDLVYIELQMKVLALFYTVINFNLNFLLA